MEAVADTSVIVSAVLAGSDAHEACFEALSGSDVHAAGHAWIESFSVLTRLPIDVRLSGIDAHRVISAAVNGTRLLKESEQRDFCEWLESRSVVGGSIYDALVGWVARCADVPMMTKDVRAVPTYRAIGITTLFIES